MVKIMLSPTAAGQGCGEENKCDTYRVEDDAVHTFGGNQLPIGPTACTFWCAVAIGSLVKGSPVQSVSDRYPAVSIRSTQLSVQGHVHNYEKRFLARHRRRPCVSQRELPPTTCCALFRRVVKGGEVRATSQGRPYERRRWPYQRRGGKVSGTESHRKLSRGTSEYSAPDLVCIRVVACSASEVK